MQWSRTVDLYVDDRRMALGVAADATFADALAELKQTLASDGRMIVSIHCDGIDITGPAFAESLARPVNALGRVDMQTADPVALVGEALTTADELLDTSQQSAQEVVDLLAQGKSESALPQLSGCCQAWLQVHEGICNAIAMLRLDPNTLMIGERSLTVVMEEPADRLRQLKETLEAGDLVLLADILTYEFPDAINAWRDMLATLQQSVEAASPSNQIPG
jgi:hypothetical protein